LTDNLDKNNWIKFDSNQWRKRLTVEYGKTVDRLKIKSAFIDPMQLLLW